MRRVASRTFILDSTAFYAGISSADPSINYTTDLVVKEVSRTRSLRRLVKILTDAGRLKVRRPSESSLKKAQGAAERSGDMRELSEVDVSVVALALDLREEGFDVVVVSDDFSVQNLAEILLVRSTPVMTRGIRRRVYWIIYCQGCGKTFRETQVKVCDVCGTRLRRRLIPHRNTT